MQSMVEWRAEGRPLTDYCIGLLMAGARNSVEPMA